MWRYILNDDFEKAKTTCDAAVGERSMRAFSHNNRGVLLLVQGDFEGAEHDFKKAQANNLQSYVHTREQRAIAHIVSGNSGHNQERLAAIEKSGVRIAAKADSD